MENSELLYKRLEQVLNLDVSTDHIATVDENGVYNHNYAFIELYPFRLYIHKQSEYTYLSGIDTFNHHHMYISKQHIRIRGLEMISILEFMLIIL